MALDSLNEITQFKTGSTIANGMKLSEVAVNKYKASIEGLSLSQAQLALSNTALNDAQKEQIIISAGLLKTTDSITASEIKQTVTENILTSEKQQEILATFELEMAEGKLTWERLEAIATEDSETGAIARLIVAKKEENAQNLKNIASSKALTTVLKEQLLALATNPMTWVVAGLAGVVTVAHQCSKAIEEVEAKAQELNETFSTSKTEIEDYKTQIDGLYKVINDSGSSIEDVTTARQNLMAIQDQLIEKFGDEKETIDLITDAINGQTEALNILTEKQWQAAKNEFNESGFWNNVANGIDGYSNNIDRMLGEYEGYKVTIDMSKYGGTLFTEGYDEFKQMLMDDFGATISQAGSSYLELSGDASEVRQKLLDIQEILKENSTYKPDDTFSDYLGGLERSANNVIEKYEDFYKQYVLYEEIFTNDTFTDSYKKINKAYSEYQDAFATGDEESIKKAQDNFASILTQATEGVSDESVLDFFNDMYPDLQEVVGNWQFEMNFTANTDGLKDDVSGYLSGLDGLYSYDLKNFSYDTATEEQKASYDGLISVARLYGLTIDQLIDKLVLMGLVQDEEYQRLVDKFGKENVAKIAPEDLTFAYQIKNVGDMSFEEFQAEIQRLKDEASNPDETDILSIDQAWANLDTTVKKDLLELAESGKLTISAFESTTGADTFLDQIKMTAEEATEWVNALSDEASQLASMGSQVSKMSDALATKSKDGYVDYSTLSGFDAEVRGLDSWDEFQSKLGSSKSSMEECQAAANALATEWVNNNNFLENLNETNKDYYITQLDLMGVENSVEVVESRLTSQKEALELKTRAAAAAALDFANGTDTATKALIEETGMAEETQAAIANLIAQEQIFNATGLSVEGKIAQLSSLASMYLSTAAAANFLNSVASKTNGMGNDPRFYTNDYITKKWDESFQIDLTTPKISPKGSGGSKNTGKSPGSKDSTDKTKEETEEIFDWIERKIKSIQNKIDKWLKQAETTVKSKLMDTYYSAEKNQLSNLATTYAQAFTKYMEKANSSGVSETYKKKVADGSIEIESIKNDAIKEQIKNYQEWYDKAQEALASLVDTAEKLYNVPLEKAAKKIELLNSAIERLDKQINVAIGSVNKNNLIKSQITQQNSILNAQQSAKTGADQNYSSALSALKSQLNSSKKLKSAGLSTANFNKVKASYNAGEEVDLTLFKEGTSAYAAAVKYNEAVKARTKATENLANAQAEYTKWLREANKQMFDNIAQDYERSIQKLGYNMSSLDNQMSIIEARGQVVGRSFYEAQNYINKKQLAEYEKELSALKNQLSTITEGTDEWYEALDTIQQVSDAIAECTKNTYEYNNAIRELETNLWNNIRGQIDRFSNEQSFLQSLFAHENLTDDDTGMFTNAGIAKLGSVTAQYYAATSKVEIDKQRYDKIKAIYDSKNLEGTNYDSLNEVKADLDEIYSTWQDDIKEAYNSETELADLMKEKYQVELDYLKELIEDRKDALSAQKDLHDYQKSLLEKNNNINTLQRQISAYSGDTSQESMAKLQQLQSKLIEAQEDLQETEYNRYIQDQEDMLDKLYEEYEELITKKLDDFYSLVQEGIKTANSNTSEIKEYLSKVAQAYDYTEENGNIFNDKDTIEESTKSIIKSIKELETAMSGTNKESVVADSPVPGGDYNNGVGGNANNSSTNTSKTANSTNIVVQPQARLESVNGVSATKIKNYVIKYASPATKDRSKYSAVNQLLYDHLGKKVLSSKELNKLAEMLDIPKKWTKSSLMYETLSNIKGIGFSEGGIGKLVKANGEDGIALVRNGEGFVKPEDVDAIKKLLDTVPVMYDVMDSFKTIPTLPKTVPLTSMGDVSFNFNIEGVQNANDLVKAIQTDNKVQKAIQSVSIDRVMGGGKLTVNQIVR